MSEEAVNVVSRLLDAHNREDVLIPIREFLGELDEHGPEHVFADNDPWSLYSPEIVWDMSAVNIGAGSLGGAQYGYDGLVRWWSTFASLWARYEYRMQGEPEDLGEWVLTKGDVIATAPNGQAVQMPIWQLWAAGEGQVAVMRAFVSEAAAREAAGPETVAPGG